MKVKAIITGATGMVGEGVLHECLHSSDVEEVLVINRKPCGVIHPKLKEIIHNDFFNLAPVEKELTGYNACFFCLGVSSIGLNEQEYSRLSYDLTLGFAGVVARRNPGMVFCYVSGSGTDTTEQGRSMWARVKGRTENALRRLPFRRAYLFRPGYMHPTPGLKNTLKPYRFVSWMYPVLRAAFPKYVCSLKELGLAMIACVTRGYEKQVLEVRDIVTLAKNK